MNLSDTDLKDICTICVLTYNRCDQLEDTLQNLRNQFYHEQIEIIIVNNGSNDQTSDILEKLTYSWPQLKIINCTSNSGCAKGREIAWREVKTEYILSIDDDIIISYDSLCNMLKTIEKYNNGALVSPSIADDKTKKIINPLLGKIEDARFFYEACFLINKNAINTVGYFDPLLKFAGEGLDYSIRLRKVGYRILRALDVTVIHVDRKRLTEDLADRRKDWLWSFCYVYCKNYSFPISFILSTREFLSHVRSGLFLYGIKFVLSLIKPAISGSKHGIAKRQYL